MSHSLDDSRGANLTVDEAAELLGTSTSFVWRLINEDRIPHVRWHNYCRIGRHALDGYRARCEYHDGEWHR